MSSFSSNSYLEVEWHICFDYPGDAHDVTPAEIPRTLHAAEIHLPILVIGVPADSIAGFCVAGRKRGFQPGLLVDLAPGSDGFERGRRISAV